jgi:probable HAF family extracellular repeat protein
VQAERAFAQAYELIDLGTLGGSTATASGINTLGQVVGSSTTTADAATHAFLYSQGIMTDLGTLGGTSSWASGINDTAQVVGSSSLASGLTHATLWDGTTATDLDPGDTAVASSANGINNAGTIIGNLGIAAAYFFGGGSPSEIGYPESANAISSGGIVVGTNFSDAAELSPFFIQLPILFTYSYAYAINDSDVIVGVTNVTLPIAELWSISDPYNPTTQLLTGGVAGVNPHDYMGEFAYGINGAGQIVGSAQVNGTKGLAISWASADVAGIDLNATLRPQAANANTLASAVAINANGLILANGIVTATGAAHAYLLTPVTSPGPPTTTLSVSTAAIMVGQSFVLSWSSTNAWACVAGGSGPSGALPWNGIVATSGTQTIPAGSLPGKITATLNCSFGNQSATAQTIVTVSYPPLTVALAASPTTIMSGQATTLTWSSVNATSCMASGGALGDGWTDTTRATSGSATIKESNVPVSPTTLTFTLTCKSSKTGQATAASARVVENPPAKSGGGAFDLLSVVALLFAGYWRTMRTLSATPTFPFRAGGP